MTRRSLDPAAASRWWIGDEQVGEGRLDKTIPVAATSYAGMDVSRDNGAVVDLAYESKAPYEFTGTVKRARLDLKPATTHDDEKALHEHASIHAVAHGVAS